VERLVSEGIVVVASAGNRGATQEYPKIWGSTNSPANNPQVLAVYPINTRGTVTHTDDVATSYGSRGPSHLDHLFKPDLSAPGNSITSLLVRRSKIQRDHPELQTGRYYMTLSGASMATPFVSGTVALMLEANPNLDPDITRRILLLTASKLEQPHMLEQGNGLVNALTAVRLAKAIDLQAQNVTGTVPPQVDLGGGRGSLGRRGFRL